MTALRVEIGVRWGVPAAFEGAGPTAVHFVEVFWLYFGVAVAVFGVVLGICTWAVLRAKRPRVQPRPDERGLHRAIGLGVASTVLCLIVLLLGSLRASKVEALPDDALRVRVTGYLWWWEVEYFDADGALSFTTANELRIPVGQPVRVELVAGDVIHGFWVPALGDKLDMIPGRRNVLRLRADQPGTYRGQCAEFCGAQHAKMAFHVVAERRAEFERWREHMRAPAPVPEDPLALRGRRVFRAHCARCHVVREDGEGNGRAIRAPETATREIGPELTHLGGRVGLAAGTLPNTEGYLAGWIADPQGIKPGNRMPRTYLRSEDLVALVHYLTHLE